MARTTLANAKAELFGLLQSGGTPTVAGVTKVFDHEPASGQALKPVSITLFTAGATPTEWLITVRVYVSADVDVRKAQADLDLLMAAIEARLTSGYGPSQWDIEYADDLKMLVATWLLEVGREDIDD